MRVSLIQRQPRKANFSVEGYFARVLAELLARDLRVELKVAPDLSRGFLPRLRIVRFARLNQGDVSHITGDIHFAALGTKPERTVVTVLDCGRLHVLSGWKRTLMRLVWFKWPLMRAGAITAISEETKRDLLRWVPDLDESKVHVVPVSVSPAFKPCPREFNLTRPRVLQVGTKENKNILRLASALRGLNCELRIIGDLTDAQREHLKSTGVTFTTATGLSETSLVKEYEESDIVAFASTFEGFGMPIVEAQMVGRPVITSSLSSMPEVAGAGAVLVDPLSTDSIRVAFKRIVEDAGLREELVEAGARNAKRFETATICDQYSQIYERLHRA